MSFRELRSFTEIMKSLGYPRLISMENFRLPNFELVADCLYWLVHRYYPGVDISDEISTEADRVKFLQSVAQVMLTKARMKLNIKKLYSADGLAVKELLKVASLLYKATEKALDDDEESVEPVDFSAVLKGFNPKEIKANASEIIKAGGMLYDALGQEPQMREHRARAIAGHVDTDYVERSIQEAIGQVEDHIRSLEQQLDDLERSERTLDSKIEKKKQELERNEKRLTTLQSVRPAYMDEYERLQGELNMLYGQYLDRFRNLEFLENELEQYYQAEQEKMEAQDRRLKKMQRRLAEEELRILRGEQEVDESNMRLGDLDDDDEDEDEDEDEDDLSNMSEDQPSRRGRGGGKPSSTWQNFDANKGGRGKAQVMSMDGGRQVVGKMDDVDDDEASIDEDNNSDGGEVSNAGSEPKMVNRGYGGYARDSSSQGYGLGAEMMGDDEDDLTIQDDDEDNDF